MVEITFKVAGEETEQDEEVNRKQGEGGNSKGMNTEKVSSEDNRGTTHEAHHSAQFSKL